MATDAFSFRGIEITKESTDRLKANNVKLFSVATTNLVNKPELDELTSKPIDRHRLMVDLKKTPFTKEQVGRFAKEICNSK